MHPREGEAALDPLDARCDLLAGNRPGDQHDLPVVAGDHAAAGGRPFDTPDRSDRRRATCVTQSNAIRGRRAHYAPAACRRRSPPRRAPPAAHRLRTRPAPPRFPAQGVGGACPAAGHELEQARSIERALDQGGAIGATGLARHSEIRSSACTAASIVCLAWGAAPSMDLSASAVNDALDVRRHLGVRTLPAGSRLAEYPDGAPPVVEQREDVGGANSIRTGRRRGPLAACRSQH